MAGFYATNLYSGWVDYPDSSWANLGVGNFAPGEPIGIRGVYAIEAVPSLRGLIDPTDGVAKNGFLPEFYHRDVLYNKVLISKTIEDVGIVVSTVTLSFNIWSTFFSDITLQSIAETGTDGMNLISPYTPPVTIKALQEDTFTVEVTPQGPYTIDATYDFVYQGLYTLSFNIVGIRIVIWLFEPDWGADLRETLQWKTDVLTAYDGTEQRFRLMANPRRNLEYRVSTPTQELRALFSNILYGWHERLFALPVWYSETRLSADAFIGDSSITLDSVNFDDLQVGGLVVLWVRGTYTYEVFTVTDITGNVVSLDSTLQKDWPQGIRVYPAVLANLQLTATVEHDSDILSRLDVDFIVKDAPARTASDPNPTYRTLPVLDTPVDWGKDQKTDLYRKATEIDFGRVSEIYRDIESAVPQEVVPFRWVFAQRADIESFIQWLYSKSGRLKPFWFPTWRTDMVVTQTIAASDTTITIKNIKYTTYVNLGTNRKDIMIELKDGTKFYRRITAASVLSDTEESLTIDASLGVSVAPSDIKRVSYMWIVRLDTDRVEMLWHSYDGMTVDLSFRSLNYDV